MNVSTSTLHPRRRRLKRVDEEENAATLQLGPEFQVAQVNHQGQTEELIALNLSETRLIIKEALIERRRAFLRNQKRAQGVHHENGGLATESEGESTAVEDNVDMEDDALNAETREKELETLDSLLEQTTGGTNKNLKNTMEYLTNFSRFRDQETVSAVIQLLKSTNLHPFEIAQLGTLACDTADESKTLIPSLTNKISDDDLERILKEMSNLETLY